MNAPRLNLAGLLDQRRPGFTTPSTIVCGATNTDDVIYHTHGRNYRLSFDRHSIEISFEAM